MRAPGTARWFTDRRANAPAGMQKGRRNQE
ncbi:Uncharacterised protein [Bordetella pertussis]|nr:Uncharacterised protein [Bordetella pertussis]